MSRAAHKTPFAKTMAVLGERWTLLILSECFMRRRRFEEFQASLGVSRAILADRLKILVRHGILRRVPYDRRYEYRLTEKGLDLYPLMMAIFRWGDQHKLDGRGRPALLQHVSCGNFFDPTMVCPDCGEPIDFADVAAHGHRGM